MTANVGGIDRTLRIVVGLVSFRPLYTVLGINTCPMKKG